MNQKNGTPASYMDSKLAITACTVIDEVMIKIPGLEL